VAETGGWGGAGGFFVLLFLKLAFVLGDRSDETAGRASSEPVRANLEATITVTGNYARQVYRRELFLRD